MREHWQVTADTAIADYERHGAAYADAAGVEMGLEAERHLVKDAAIRRIMETPNSLNSDKPHSATSAEKIVETDPEYAAYLRRQRETAREKNHAFTAMTAAKLRAELAIAALRASEGVGA